MPTKLDQIRAYLEQHHPVQDGLWSYSTNNRLPADWLQATPTGVFGTPYDQFKMAVKGDYPGFELEPCSGAATPPHSCEALGATVTAPGQKPASLMVGHSEAMVEAVYDVMVSAEKFIDIALLTPPTGRYLAAMRNAVTFLGHRPEATRPIIRVLHSNPPMPPQDNFLRATGLLGDLTSGLDDRTAMTIYVGVVSSSISSWNHSKIVAADGALALVGGHNLWTPPYLNAYPVFDVSMKLEGEAVLHTHDYVDFLWRFVIKSLEGKKSWFTLKERLNNVAAWARDPAGKYGVRDATVPPADLYTSVRPQLAPAPGGNLPVLAVGRQAAMDASAFLPTSQTYLREFAEPADLALRQMVATAQSTIRISQHSLSFPFINKYVDTEVFFWWGTWNFELFMEIGRAMLRGVDVYVTVSNPGALAGDHPYIEFGLYTGEDPAKVNRYMLDVLTKHLGMDDAAARRLMGSKFRAGSFRYKAGEDQYGNGSPIPNHSKTLIVDDRLFYVGSQNLYKSNLNEFGYVVEDAAAGETFVSQYFGPLWRESQGTVDTSYSDELAGQMDAEAVGFILEMRHNRRLGRTWVDTLEARAGKTSDDELAETAIILNDIIANAGFYTNSSSVLAVAGSPFFTTDQDQSQPNDDARRFVRDLMTDRALLVAFAAVVGVTYETDSKANAAIHTFLTQKGYACTALQASAALHELRPQTLAYWIGTYAGWVKPDGGTAYTDFTPAAGPPLRTRSLAASPTAAAADDHDHDPDAIRTVDALPLVVIDNLHATLGGDQLKGLTFADGVLSWDTSAGNRTSGSLTFSEIGQPGLDDHYTGLECYGTVTWPDDGTAPYRGKVSYYGRWSKAANVDHPDKPTPFPWPVGLLLGLVGLIGLAAVGYALWRRKLAAEQLQRRRILDALDQYEPLDARNFTEWQQLTDELRAGRISASDYKTRIARMNRRAADYSEEMIELPRITRRRLGQLEARTSGVSVDRGELYREIKASLEDMIKVQQEQLVETLKLDPSNPTVDRLGQDLVDLGGRVDGLTPATSAADVGKLFQEASKQTVAVNDYVERTAVERAADNQGWLDNARILDGQRLDLASQANVARAKLDLLDRYDPPEETDLPDTRIDLPDEI